MTCPFPGCALDPDHDGQHSHDCVACRHPYSEHTRKAGPFEAACRTCMPTWPGYDRGRPSPTRGMTAKLVEFAMHAFERNYPPSSY